MVRHNAVPDKQVSYLLQVVVSEQSGGVEKELEISMKTISGRYKTVCLLF